MRTRDATLSVDETSMEQSFESAEQSLSEADSSFDQGSDPFLMPPIATRQIDHQEQDEDEEEDEDQEEDGSDTASETDEEDDEDAVMATISPGHRRDTVRPISAPIGDISMESEDPLAAMDHLDVSRNRDESPELTDEEAISDQDSAEDDTEGEEEDDDDDEGDSDSEEEETEEEVADDEDEGGEGESSFAASSATSDTASISDSDTDTYSRGRRASSDESVVGRGATQRRKSGSPIKKSRPSNNASSSAKAKAGAKQVKLAPARSVPVKTKKVVSPLQEKMVQDVVEISDDEEIIPVKTPQKKRYVPIIYF
jgi:hypothetical protein